MKKALKIFAGLLIAGVAAASFAACDDSHEHTFSEEYSGDGEYHWYEATCEHTDEVKDKAKHTESDWIVDKVATCKTKGSRHTECTVCHKKLKTETLAEDENVHEYSAVWKTDENKHWHEATCEHTDIKGDEGDHDYGDWQTTEATCTEDGEKVRACKVCGYEDTDPIASSGHDWETTPTEDAPTCTEDGSRYVKCKNCTAVKDVTTIPATGHTFNGAVWEKDENSHWHPATCGHNAKDGEAVHTFPDSWTERTPATSTAEGLEYRACTVCGQEQTRAIPMLGHVHTYETEWTQTGTEHYHASTCGHEPKDRGAHTPGDWEEVKAPTYEEDGSRHKVCTVCGYETETETLPKFGIPFIKDGYSVFAFSENNTDLGVTYEGCTDGLKINVAHPDGEAWHIKFEKNIDVAADTYYEYKVVYNTTKAGWLCLVAEVNGEIKAEQTATVGDNTLTVKFKSAGTSVYTNLQLGALSDSDAFTVIIKSVELKVHTHEFGTEWKTDENKHWHEATCGHTEVKEDEGNHTWSAWDETAATETEDGSKTRSCNTCGREETVVIPATGHTHEFASAWTTSETKHWHAATCAHTNEKSEEGDHVFGDPVVVNPTLIADGSETRTCTTCGYESVKVLTKLGDSFEVQTAEGATASKALVAGSGIQVTVTNSTGTDWHVKLAKNLTCVPGTAYEYTFVYSATATGSGMVKIEIGDTGRVIVGGGHEDTASGDNTITVIFVAAKSDVYTNLQLGKFATDTVITVKSVSLKTVALDYGTATDLTSFTKDTDKTNDADKDSHSDDFLTVTHSDGALTFTMNSDYVNAGKNNWDARVCGNLGFTPASGTAYLIAFTVEGIEGEMSVNFRKGSGWDDGAYASIGVNAAGTYYLAFNADNTLAVNIWLECGKIAANKGATVKDISIKAINPVTASNERTVVFTAGV